MASGRPPVIDEPLRRRLERLDAGPGCCEELESVVARLDESAIEAAAARHRVLADPTRLRLLTLIDLKPGLCGCELQAATGLTHATVSHHMRQLASAGWVVGERKGKWVHYALTRTGRLVVPPDSPES